MPRLLNQHPGRSGALALGALPFLLIVAAYIVGSDLRLASNPNDKLLPSFAAFGAAIQQVAFEPDARSGDILLWKDTASSLLRLGSGILISALLGLAAGVLIGVIPRLRAAFAPLVAVLSLIPPLAILPILFIVFGLGEVSKIVLIVIGITPFLIRDLALRTGEIPPEQLIKAQTLGASTWLVILRVVLPQILPRLLDAVRLSLGAAWLFLIAAEAIAATDGLGYRIFLVRRYLAMDLILPYVAWITLLAYAFDLLLRRLSRRLFPWYHAEMPRA
ncbi:MAG: ABC transporter permease subunit [Gammaproteobacteria bacterium]|nr:ABC transporter permease subunit [Gammaproteobacteria bacterium]